MPDTNMSRLRQMMWQDLADALNALETFDEAPLSDYSDEHGQFIAGLSGYVSQGEDGCWSYTPVARPEEEV